MAFYLRKFGRSIRILPGTKSFGFSTRANEGDKLKEDGSYSKTLGKKIQGDAITESTLPLPIPPLVSSLVPLSVRDMALVLLPRLSGDAQHTPNDFDSFMGIAKAVPFTCDDILPSCLNLPADTIAKRKDSVVSERFVIGGQPPRHTETNSYSMDGLHTSISPLRREADKWALIRDNNTQDNVSGTGCNFDTILMRDKPLQSLDVFLFCSDGTGNDKPSKSKDGPSLEQLHSIKERLENSVQIMFTSRYDYSILHKNVVFENHLFGESRTKTGQTAYALELLSLRLRIHARFSSTMVEVLNTTVHEDRGLIRVHWRLKGLPQTELLKFWRIFTARDEISKDDWQWFEAFSYFRIGKDGLVHNHRIDRMLPGSEEPDKLSKKLGNLLNPKPLVS